MQIKNTKEIIDFINDIEINYPVDTWIVNGYHIWPLLRIEIGYHLNYLYIYRDSATKYKAQTRLKSTINFLKKSVQSYKEPYYSIWKDAKHNDKVSQRDVLHISDGCGYINIMGKHYERYYDSFNSFFKNEGITELRLDMHHNYVSPRISPSIYIQSKLELHMIKKLVFGTKPKVDFSGLLKFQEFLAFCAENNIDTTSLNPSNLAKRLIKLDAIQSFFGNIIDKVQPKLVFITCFQSDYGLAIINLCRAKGIKTIDVQHGFQESLHPAYGCWRRVPQEGYNLLPDYFWCWGAAEASTINDWSGGLAIHKPLAGGNLLLNLLSDTSNAIVENLNQQFSQILDTRQTYQETKTNILFTLQWDTTGDEMLMPLFETMQQTEHKYNWWLRLHPVMLTQRKMIEQLFIKNGLKNFELDFSTDLPLYIVLSKTDIHITCSSAVVIEAHEFGISSIIINEYGELLFKDFIKKGIVKKAYTSADIITTIEEMAGNIGIKKQTTQKSKFNQIPELHYLKQLIKAAS